MVISFGHVGRTLIAALLKRHAASDYHPIADRLFRGDNMTRGRRADWHAVLIPPSAHGPLGNAHVTGDGAEVDQPFFMGGARRGGHQSAH